MERYSSERYRYLKGNMKSQKIHLQQWKPKERGGEGKVGEGSGMEILYRDFITSKGV